jgi:hypothetical protein
MHAPALAWGWGVRPGPDERIRLVYELARPELSHRVGPWSGRSLACS